MKTPVSHRIQLNIICAVFMLCWAGKLSAQEIEANSTKKDLPYIINTWRVDDGLPHNHISDILQRKNGYIWLATQNGAVRFDGINFQSFNTRVAPALPNNRIAALFEDASGNLFMGHNTGHVTIRIGSEFSTLKCPDEWIGEPIVGFVECEDHSVWAENSQGKYLRVGDGKTPLLIPDQSTDTLNNRPPEGWSVVQDRIVRIIGEKVQDDLGPTPWRVKEQAFHLIERTNGDVVAGTSAGGVFILPRTGGFTQIRLSEGLTSITVLCLIEDAEGTLWIGTPAGLQSIRFLSPSFSGMQTDWAYVAFRSITPRRNGGVWVGSNKGQVYIYDGTRLFGPIFVYDEKVTRALYEDMNGNLWLNNDHGLLLRFNERSGSVTTITPISGEKDEIWAICETANGQLWAGGKKGLWNKTPEGWKLVLDSNHGISDIQCLTGTKEGTLWIGMKHRGLAHFKNNELGFFTAKDGFSANHVSALYADEDQLWIGTYENGLFLRDNGYIQKVPLEQNIISDILPDGTNRLWVAGEAGVAGFNKHAVNSGKKIEPELDSFELLNRDSGINVGIDMNQSLSSACRTQDGQFWFISNRHITTLHPTEITPFTAPVPMLITDAHVNGTYHALEGKQSIMLPPGVHRMDINFTALSYTSISRIKFRCRLIGLSDEWIDLGSRRVASYQYLPPGKYRFEVTASNRDGFLNREQTGIDIIVEPFYWETLWFKILIYLFGGSMIVLISLGVAERINRRKLIHVEKSKAVEQERTRIAMDLHDEIGSELTRLQLLCHRSSMALKKMGLSPPLESLGEIQQVTNKLVGALDEMVWVVRPTNDNFDNLAGYLAQYITTFLQNTGIRSDINMPLNLPTGVVPGPIRHHLFLAIKEAVNNVVKHAEAKQINFVVAIESDGVTFALHDDGNGMNPEKDERFKRGLRSMRRRMELAKGEFRIYNRETGGTSVEFKIPLIGEKS